MISKFALVIANTDYQDTTFAKLTAPGQDAEEFASVLRDPELGSFDEVRVLMNQREGKTRRTIAHFFLNRRREDLLLLYFSGHGVRSEQGQLFLAAKDTEIGLLEATGIRAEFITRAMNNSRSQRQLLILDCCNSGAFAYGSKSAGSIGSSMGIGPAFEGSGFGRVVLTATDATQYAWEGDKVIGDTQNSVFTHFLIKGLKGEADRNRDGRIDVDELYDYTYEQVVQRTPKQTPGKWSYKQQGDIILCENLKLQDIKPTPLPSEVLELLKHPNPSVRHVGIQDLFRLVDGKHLGLARAAEEKLREVVASDDSLSIRTSANEKLIALGNTYEIPIPGEMGVGTGDEAANLLQQEALKEGSVLVRPQHPGNLSLLREKLSTTKINFQILKIAGMVAGGLLFAGFGVNYLVRNWPALFRSTEPVVPRGTAPMIAEKDDMPLVYIPAGDFEMGSDGGNSEERPIHTVYLDDYWIDETEVTNKMYMQCVTSGRCDTPKDSRSNTRASYFGDSEYDNYPVIFIDWNRAKTYCEWAERRLPTEAEWEKAARGTVGLTFPWGDDPPSTNLLNYDGNVGDTTETGKYLEGVSVNGAYDMAGNAWEWVSSAYMPYPYDPDDGREDQSVEPLRVFRGGSWDSNEDLVRTTYRGRDDPRQALINFGFRCASSTPP